MTRGYDLRRLVRSRRESARERPELRLASSPREFPASPFSMAIKKEDPLLRALIDAWIDQALKERRAPP